MGYTLGASIAFAYLPVDDAKPGTEVEVNIFGDWLPGVVTDQPLWDPKSTRVLADTP
jgi:glycine cleavage system aminomethyltransferase T